MKACAYCGRENEDAAIQCCECGTEGFKDNSPPQSTPEGPKYHFGILGPDDLHKELVTLVSCRTLQEADLIVCHLNAVDIPAFIPDEHLMQVISFNLNTFGYVRVQVSPKNYDEAKSILTSME